MQKIKDFIYFNRKEILIVSVSIIAFLCYIFFNNESTTGMDNTIVEEEIIKEKEEIKDEIEEIKVVVDIKGEVTKPGTYEMILGKRVIDVINESGGLTTKADTSNINLSEKITDEMLIVIPSKDDIKKEEINNKTTPKKEQNDGKVSINTASIDELKKIKGIGDVKAKSIIEYRNENGRFKSIEEITNVNGIGSSTFEKIKNYIKI